MRINGGSAITDNVPVSTRHCSALYSSFVHGKFLMSCTLHVSARMQMATCKMAPVTATHLSQAAQPRVQAYAMVG